MRTINEIIVHCTATNPSWYADKSAKEVVEEIRRWHVTERNWSDIGYHVVIHRSGEIAAGRPVTRSGAHTRGRNKHSIGVALVGGRGGCADDAFLDNYTPEQEKALRGVIEDMKREFPAINKVSAHNMYAQKACPCFKITDWLE